MDCGHEGCRCRVAEGEEYCSEHCREHAGTGDHARCACGHPVCVDTAGGSTEQDIQDAFD